MNPSLENQLVLDHRRILHNCVQMDDGSWYFGVECNDGWFNLIATTLERLNTQEVIVTQIKEQYGSLRIYFQEGNEYVRGVVDLAESLSTKICDICGDHVPNRDIDYWLPRCSTHEKV